DRLRGPLRDEPQHRRQRPAGADGAGHHQQIERRQGRGAGEEGHALRTGRGRRLSRRPRPEVNGVVMTETTAASAPAPPDERLVRVGPLSRLLTRPDIGALLGAIAIFFAFAYFARAVDWLSDPGIAAGWTDQAAQYGIVAVPVALLMIGGEFDL